MVQKHSERANLPGLACLPSIHAWGWAPQPEHPQLGGTGYHSRVDPASPARSASVSFCHRDKLLHAAPRQASWPEPGRRGV